jgi:hypothetical protein
VVYLECEGNKTDGYSTVTITCEKCFWIKERR